MSEDKPLPAERMSSAAAASAADGADPDDTASRTKGPKTVGSFVGESPKRKAPSMSSHGSGRGTQKGDDERAQRKMLEALGTLEVGHVKQRPIFPSVVLGHLFMQKYGLSHEQRSQLVRATGGSCRFEDVEKVLRASDFEDRPDHGRRHGGDRGRRDAVMVADAGSSGSMSEMAFDASSAEAHELDCSTDDEEVQEELEEAYEVQKKEKAKAKRHFRSYKESRRNIQEIKKNRQPYMPVVALAPGSQGSASASAPIQPTFKYDRKKGSHTDKEKHPKKGGRKEEVSMVSGTVITEFAYAVDENDLATQEIEYEVLMTTIPEKRQ